jgi:hypothetical protein
VGEEILGVAGEELREKVDVHGGELASVEDLIEDSDSELEGDTQEEDNETYTKDLGALKEDQGADSVDPGADYEAHRAGMEDYVADRDGQRADTEEHLAEAEQKASEWSHQNGQEQIALEKDLENTEHGPSCDCLDCDDADFLHGFVDGEPWGIK